MKRHLVRVYTDHQANFKSRITTKEWFHVFGISMKRLLNDNPYEKGTNRRGEQRSLRRACTFIGYCFASARKLKSEPMDEGSEQKRTGYLFRFKHYKLILTIKTISHEILALKLHRRTSNAQTILSNRAVSQRMDVDEDSPQTVEHWPCWIHQQ